MTAYYQGNGPVAFGTPSMTTTSLGPNDPPVGTRTTWNSGEYLFIFNGGNSTLSQYYGATIQAAATNYSCTVTTTTLTDTVLGVVQHADIATSAYGWILTKGFGTIKMGADNSAAVGERFAAGTNGLFGRVGSSNTDVVLGSPLGKVASAVASGASCGAWISCFG